ncbi:MAG TPA: hypothetical protein VMI54_02950 [Polyangiaceae bacterium]|nr:hypothetical protein [Polyangiaceae bacterium]
MLERYKRTFFATQACIVCVTVAILIQSHRIFAAAVFFVTMELGAVVGAMWAARLKRRIERSQGFLSSR